MVAHPSLPGEPSSGNKHGVDGPTTPCAPAECPEVCALEVAHVLTALTAAARMCDPEP